jgi:hypothetical protein
MGKKILTPKQIEAAKRALDYAQADYESLSGCDWDKATARELKAGIRAIEKLIKNAEEQ